MKYLVGGHVSVSGGVDKAVVRASNIGANCMQIFSGSPRVWKRKDLKLLAVDKLFAKQKKLGVRSIIIHSIYLINLASKNDELLVKSFSAVKYDLEFSSLVKALGVVVHLGSHQGRGWEAVREGVKQQIIKLLEVTPSNSYLLIENSAGQKGKLCSELSEVRWLLDEVNNSRLGWCFDTCHAFANGYSLGKGGSRSVVKEITNLSLWSSLRCVHVNDSRDEFGSGRDRHANLEQGYIPVEDLRSFVNDKRVKKLPLILEVPGENKEGPNVKNINTLKSYLT